MRILVTGATGFIGHEVASHLAARGIAVRALARKGSRQDALRSAGIEIAPGDVRDFDAVREALRGCSHVIHLAALRSNAHVTPRMMHEVNVRGTANLAQAARAEGIARFVYGSTLGVHGFVTGVLLDERSPIRPNSPYRHTKWLGEQLVRSMHAREGLPVVVGRISSVVGAGATAWLPLTRGIRSRRMRLIGRGANAIDLVGVKDIVDGLWRCATAAKAEGQCYVLGSARPSTVRGFVAAIAQVLGVEMPPVGPPAAPYRVLMRAAALAFRAVGMHSAFAHDREMLVADKAASSARAGAELGYAPCQPLEAAIHAMVAQFIAEGRVAPEAP